MYVQSEQATWVQKCEAALRCFYTSSAAGYQILRGELIGPFCWILFVEQRNLPIKCFKLIFIAPLLKIRFSVPAKRDETAIFNPRGENLKVGLQTALSFRFTGTENQILKTVAMKNSIHYSKQNTANATRVAAALASLGQQTSHSFAIAVFRPL